MSTPQVYLQRALAREHGNRAAVARRIGLSRQRLSDALKGRGDYPLGVKACLQLAVEYSEDPVDVLCANKKAAIADLLVALGLGKRPVPKKTAAVQRLERRLAELSARDRATVEEVISRLLERRAPPRTAR